MPVQNLPFIENMEKRIQNASLTLDASLGHCFVDGLEHRDATAIYNCLRAYAAIDNTTSAEEIFQTTLVAPLIQKIILHGSSAMANGSSGDGLDSDYLQIKECIDKDCKFLLEISSAGTSSDSFFHYSTSIQLNGAFVTSVCDLHEPYFLCHHCIHYPDLLNFC